MATPAPLAVGCKITVTDGKDSEVYEVVQCEDRPTLSGGSLPYVRLTGPTLPVDYWEPAATVHAWVGLGYASIQHPTPDHQP